MPHRNNWRLSSSIEGQSRKTCLTWYAITSAFKKNAILLLQTLLDVLQFLEDLFEDAKHWMV